MKQLLRITGLAGLGKGDSYFVASPETLKLCSVSSSIFKCLNKISLKQDKPAKMYTKTVFK